VASAVPASRRSAAPKRAAALVEERQQAERQPLLEPQREQLAARVIEGVAQRVDR
jgi:hypothetical protein